MISQIYIEEPVRSHPRVKEVQRRFPKAEIVLIDRYSEVFNRRSQNFRLQKKKPALILAQKFDNYVLPTPENFGVGGRENYYFSHALNCLYDCRYCFLQGMYQSAHYVFFVNLEGFTDEIERKINASTSQFPYFFSGYDSDSLALDSVTKFCDFILPFFENRKAYLELRTKSVNISPFQKYAPLNNVIVAWSFTPENVSKEFEHKVPPLDKRIEALKRLDTEGWPVGLRFDPLIYHEGWRNSYQKLLHQLFEECRLKNIHSVSLGPLRFPRNIYSKIVKLYPDEKLLACSLQARESLVSYSEEMENEIQEFCRSEILKYMDEERLFSCTPQPLVS